MKRGSRPKKSWSIILARGCHKHMQKSSNSQVLKSDSKCAREECQREERKRKLDKKVNVLNCVPQFHVLKPKTIVWGLGLVMIKFGQVD